MMKWEDLSNSRFNKVKITRAKPRDMSPAKVKDKEKDKVQDKGIARVKSI